MFERDITTELQQWKGKIGRKPLVLRGARQVGKTTVVRQFARQFKGFIYLNLELPEDKKPFLEFSNFETLLQAIFFLKNKTLADRADTLVFIDEIQEVPDVLQQLRHFYEQAPDIPVIAAGSMLESLFSPQISFPVGRVDYLVIRPASFVEFLRATGETAALQQVLMVPAAKFAHEKLLQLFRTYCLIGGMPEVVARYAAAKDLVALQSVYESLLVSYIDDVEKYGGSAVHVQHIRHAMRSSFAEAGKRITFQHFGHSPYKSREMAEALRTLEKALLLHLVYPQTSPLLPLQPDLNRSPRLQVLDTGMLNYFVGLQKEILGTVDLNDVYQGMVIEHIVGQELLARQYSALHGLTFWVRDKAGASAEVDFLFAYEGKLVPIEVKAGATGKMRSLFQFMEMAPHALAVRLYAGELLVSTVQTPNGKPFYLLNLPYYLVSQLPAYLTWLEGEIARIKTPGEKTEG